MNKNLFERAKAYILAHHRRSVWYRIMSVLAVCVVFVTTYMLVLPAITMERPTYCGLTEHIHTKECYTEQYLFTCGKLESDEHTHTDDCISTISSLTCTEPEHKHNDYCYMEEIRQEMLTDEILIDNTPEQQALPEVAYEDDAAAEEELTETETETETEAPTILTWDNLDRTADKNFALRLRTKDGAFADGSVLDVEYMNESAAAPYAESLQAQLASEEADRDVELTAVLPVKISVRDASGNEVSVRGAELSIYLNSMADVTTDTALFAQYETVNAAKWTPVNYVRMLGSAEDGEHLDANVEEGGVFLLANVQYVERATETEAPTETETEAQTEQAADTSTEAETETETAGPENAAGPSTQPQTEDMTGNGADQETGSESESETETEETTVRVLETKAPETDETGTDTTTETETETTETEPEYTCGLEEHTHDASCFAAPKNGVGIEELVCTKKIHKHDASCIGTKETESENEIKAETETASETETETESESASETEKESETEIESESVSGSEKETEMENEAESESESEMADLPFGDGGYDSEYGEGFEDNGVLTQGKEPEKESENNKAEYQPEYTCGLEEHTHVEACYNEAGELVCGLEEHVHSLDCVEAVMHDVIPGEYTDLSSHITGVSGEGTTLVPGTGYYQSNLKIDFHVTKEQAQAANLKFEYLLPEGIIVPDDLLGKRIDGTEKNKKAFEFFFEKDPETGRYRVRVEFDENYVKNAGNDIECGIEFHGRMGGNENADKDGFSFRFTDKLTLDIPADAIKDKENETWNHDIYIQKSNGRLEGNKLKYTIEVWTKKGTPGPVTLTDALTCSGFDVKSVDVQNVVANNWYSLTEEDYSFKPGTDGKSFEMTLPQMVAEGNNLNAAGGEYNRYKIEYEYTVDNIPAGVTVQADNKARVESRTDGDGKIIVQETDVSTQISKELLNKNATYNSATGEITWTITVNGGGGDITGATLTDTMFSKFTEQELRSFINPKDGFTVETDAEGKVQKVTFTQIGEAPNAVPNTQTYSIVYTTPAEPAFMEQKISNDATITTPGSGESVEKGQTVVVPGEGSVDKQCDGAVGDMMTQGDKDVIEVKWTSSIEIPSGGLKNDVMLQDQINGGYQPENHWTTKAQLQALVESVPWLTESDIECLYNWDNAFVSLNSVPDDANIREFRIWLRKDVMKAYCGTKLEFSYQTWCNVTEKDSQLIFYNKITLDSTRFREASFTYERKSKVLKMDANGTVSDSTITIPEDGKMSWKARVYFESAVSDSLTIIDTLPEDILFEGLTFGSKDNQIPVTVSEGENGCKILKAETDELEISGSYDPNPDPDSKRRKVTLTVKLKAGKTAPEYFTVGGEFWVTYNCKISDEVLEEIKNPTPGEKKTYSYKNDVTVKIGELEYGSNSQAQNFEVSKEVEKEKELSKSAGWDETNHKMKYSVEINPNAKNYIPTNDPPEDADTLTLEDHLQYWPQGTDIVYSVELDMSSVELYEAEMGEDGKPRRDANGKLIPGRRLSTSEWNWKASAYKDLYNDNQYRDITATIPDSTALILQYTYIVDGKPTIEYTPDTKFVLLQLTNNATLEGIDKTSSDTGNQDQWSDIGVHGYATTDKSYVFYKVDSNNYALELDGAVFALYQYNPSGDDVLINPEFKKSESGRFVIDEGDTITGDKKEKTGPIENDILYYVVEEKAPAGYKLPDNPPKYYFYFSTAGEKPKNMPGNINAYDLSLSSYIEYCENEMLVTDLDVEKIWYDEAGTQVVDPDKDVKVQLKRYAILDEDWKKYGFEESTGTGGSTSGSTGGKTLPVTFDIRGDDGEAPDWWGDGSSVKWYPVGSTVTVRLWNKWQGSDWWRNSIHIKNDELDNDIEDGYTNLADGREQVFTFMLTSPTLISGRCNSRIENFNANVVGLDVTFVPPAEPETETESTDTEETDPAPVEKKKPSEVKFGEAEKYGWPITLRKGNWSYHWSNLPLLGMVEDGEHAGEVLHYVYFVDEISLGDYITTYENNYGIDEGKITIVNTESNRPKISVEKEWNENGTTPSDAHKEITVGLYQKGATEADDKEIEKVKLNEANHWKYTWTEGIDETAEYYVQEISEIPGYDVRYKQKGGSEITETARDMAAQPTTANPVLVIENTRKTTSVAVRKVWQSADGKQKDADAELPEITVHLWKKGETGSESDTKIEPAITLGKSQEGHENYTEGGWGYTWPNLPEGEYYVVEDSVEGYTISYSTGSEVQSDDVESVTVQSGTITVTNTEEPTEFEVEKKWQDNDGHSIDSGQSVTVELYSSTTPPETEAQTVPVDPDPDPANPETDESESDKEEPEEPTVMPAITINVGQWLDAAGASASELTTGGWIWTKVLECDKSGQAIDPTWSNAALSGNLLSSTSPRWSLTGHLEPMSQNETKYYIVQYIAGGEDDYGNPNPIASVTLDGAGSGYSVTGSGTDGAGNEYKIIAVTGSNVTISLTAKLYQPNPVEAEEKVPVTISIGNENGKWKNESGAETDPVNDYGWICAWEEDESGDFDWVSNQYEFDSPDFDTGNSWTAIIELPRRNSRGTGKYHVQVVIKGEKGVVSFGLDEKEINKYNVDIDVSSCDSLTVTTPVPVVVEQTGGTNSVANIMQHEVAQINEIRSISGSEYGTVEPNVTTSPAVVNGFKELPGDAAFVDRVELGSVYSADPKTEKGYYSKNGWRFTWDNLPKTNEKGEPLYYYVVETNRASSTAIDYQYHYWDDSKKWEGFSGATITNTMPPTMEVTVNKKWVDQNGNSKDAGLESIDVTLSNSSGEQVGSAVTLNAGNSWTHTWTDLPIDTYTVKEVLSEGSPYTVTYETNGNLVTITNKSTEFTVKKEWAGDRKDPSVQVQLYRTTDMDKANEYRDATKHAEVVSASAMEATKYMRASAVNGTAITVRINNWQNSSNAYAQRAEAGWAWMRIWRCDEYGNKIGNSPIYPTNGSAKILSYENSWTDTVSGLPQYVMSDGEMKEQNYYVEFGASGAGNSITNVALANGANNGCIVYSKNPSNELSLTATIGEGVGTTIAMQQKMMAINTFSAMTDSENDSEKVEEAVTLSEDNKWTYTWEDLPMYDESGNPYYYYAEELDTENKYKAEYTYDETSNTETITNTKLISVTVEKLWEGFPKDAEGKERAYKVYITLYKDGKKLKDEAVLNGNIEGQNWTYTWSGLEPGEYTVQERIVYTTVDNREVQFTENTVTVSGGKKEDGNYEYTITNTYNPNRYTLPETGGPGTLPYTVGGTLLMAFASLLLYIQNKRRKEGQHTS